MIDPNNDYYAKQKVREYVLANQKQLFDSTAEAEEWLIKRNLVPRTSTVKWHDLRRDPNDLPSSDRWVLIQEGTRAYYDAASNSWRDDSNDILLFLIIAWCEIPTFEE